MERSANFIVRDAAGGRNPSILLSNQVLITAEIIKKRFTVEEYITTLAELAAWIAKHLRAESASRW